MHWLMQRHGKFCHLLCHRENGCSTLVKLFFILLKYIIFTRASSYKAHYETLQSDLRGDIHNMRHRDVDKLRAAHKKIRDYEVYRDVVETTLERLQGQIEALTAENQVGLEKEVCSARYLFFFSYWR